MTVHLAPIGIAALVTGFLVSTIGPKPPPHYIWNLTPSVPRGLYALQPPRHLRITMLVVAQPPEPLATELDRGGYLPRGVPLIKRIFALSGQTVCRVGTRVSVDGIDASPARERAAAVRAPRSRHGSPPRRREPSRCSGRAGPSAPDAEA